MNNDMVQLKRVALNEIESMNEAKENNLKTCAKNILKVKENIENMLDDKKRIDRLGRELKQMKTELNDNIGNMLIKQNQQTEQIKALIEKLVKEDEEKEKLIELKKKFLKIQPITKENLTNKRGIIDQDVLRNEMITNVLTPDEKKSFYKAIKKNLYEEFKIFINEDEFSILEDLYKDGFFWTAFHFCMFFGNEKFVKYCFKWLNLKGVLEKAIQIETKDKETPFSIFFTSRIQDLEKLEIFEYLSSKFKIDLNEKETELLRKIVESNEKS